MSDPFLVIAAGGTGGHMFPAQALAQTLLKRGWRVALSTDDRGLRYAGGFPEAVERRQVSAATFARGGVVGKVAAPFTIAAGVRDTIAWFNENKPSVVAGFGGYPSLPALAAAWRCGLPRMIHEQNGVLGRVNAVFAKRVHALATGVEIMTNAPAGAPLTFIGNPVREAALAHVGAPYAPPSGDGPIRLLVFGGSQGASVFAELLPPALIGLPPGLRARIKLTQQVRDAEIEEVRARYLGAGLIEGDEFEIAPFFSDMPERIAAAHLVVSRAGASTIAELTAIGRPAILFPYPAAAADHQTANAAALSIAGAAVVCPDAVTTAEALSETLQDVLFAPERLSRMAAASADLGRPHASEDLADLVEEVAGRR